MIDWKILAAGFVALLFVSSVLVGNVGLRDFVNQVVQGIEGLFGSDSFSGFSVAAPAGNKEIELTLHPLQLNVGLENVDISAGTTLLNNFQGKLGIDVGNNVLEFMDGTSALKVTVPMQNTEITRLTLKKFSTSGIKFLIAPNIFSSNGSLELTDFSGRAVVEAGSLKLMGNVSKARVILEGNQWELV